MLRWWSRSTSRPEDTAERLLAEGFRRVEVLDVEVRAVTDMAGLLSAARGPPGRHRGATLVGTSACLRNGCVVPESRSRGVYRALLLARACDAVAAGASTVLVKGRVATSSPVPRRAGFEVCSQEVCYERRLIEIAGPPLQPARARGGGARARRPMSPADRPGLPPDRQPSGRRRQPGPS